MLVNRYMKIKCMGKLSAMGSDSRERSMGRGISR